MSSLKDVSLKDVGLKDVSLKDVVVPQLLPVLYIIVSRHSMFRYVPTYIAHVDLGTDLPQWSQIYP